MAQEAGSGVRHQIELPFAEAVRISFQSLRIRFWRSMITTAGILLSIAFLVAIMSGAQIRGAMSELEGRAAITTAIDDTDQSEGGVSAQDYWLVIMCLIVCVVGISNSMLMAVTERFREIGTMKCLGALNKFVVELFLLESGFQGLAGAILGSFIGFVRFNQVSPAPFPLVTINIMKNTATASPTTRSTITKASVVTPFLFNHFNSLFIFPPVLFLLFHSCMEVRHRVF